ncbi:MAG: glycoside hydrolase family 140 protein, partial [Porphyromonadaceae bacterium]|nr:glycoside hydrolase family 140 protein [Porphyromonadaceae bacterium]
LKYENGKPFFWLGDTGWLLPERLNRDEVGYYLKCCQAAGFNVVQVQTINGVPAYNAYGQSSHPNGYDFSEIEQKGVYGYWDHMDFIIQTAARNGIYIGMVCIWGGLVKAGLMTVEEAQAYGKFLADRYKDFPNIIWIMGGDIPGDLKPEIWNALARTIKANDPNHLMTFHPRGRTISADYYNDAEWLDFNMFQSGHRRYGQRGDDQDYPIPENTEEDNWRYVERSLAKTPMKPVLDGEPSYERIPQGLHDPNEPLWQDYDCRRYAYWSVFAGSFGHTYGNNAIMQFYRSGTGGAYGAHTSWYEALNDPGFNQMKYLKNLMLAFPFFDRIPDQSIIGGENGEKYDRLIATRGDDYLLVYNYTGRTMEIDLTKINGKKKKAWWYNPSDGTLDYIGEFSNKTITFTPAKYREGANDCVLIVTNADKQFLSTDWKTLPDA